MQNPSETSQQRPLFRDPRIIATIDEMMNKVRDILDQFEGIIHEIWNIAQMVADMFEHIRSLFRPQRAEEPTKPEQHLPAEGLVM